MRCDTCKHWCRANEPYDRRRANGLTVRRCLRAPEWWEATEWTEQEEQNGEYWETVRALKPKFAGTKMFVQDGSDYKADLYTAEDFFCAHFEAIELFIL